MISNPSTGSEIRGKAGSVDIIIPIAESARLKRNNETMGQTVAFRSFTLFASFDAGSSQRI